MAGIPVALRTESAEMARAMSAKLAPEYDVVHVCLDDTSASIQLPEIFAGFLGVEDASGIGSNVARSEAERKTPRAVLLGKGVSEAEHGSLSAAIAQRKAMVDSEVALIRVTREDVMRTGAAGPNPDAIAEVYRMRLAGLNL